MARQGRDFLMIFFMARLAWVRLGSAWRGGAGRGKAGTL
jgi:hypothetical protein